MIFMLTYLLISFIIYVVLRPLLLVPIEKPDDEGYARTLVLGPVPASFLWPVALVFSIYYKLVGK